MSPKHGLSRSFDTADQPAAAVSKHRLPNRCLPNRCQALSRTGTNGGGECDGIGATCDVGLGFCRIAGDDIEIYADIVNDVGVYTTSLPCAPTGNGQVEAPVGSYTDLVFWLTDINTDVNEVPMIQTTGVTAEIALGNQLVDLGSVVFDFDIN